MEAAGRSDAAPATADSVRLAWPAEAVDIAAVQRRAWAAEPEAIGPALLAAIALPDMIEAWSAAISRPPQARYRVLVAVERGRIVGFATTTPGQDPDSDSTDGQLDELVVDPAAQRRGHGSRLLNAALDTLRSDGFTRAVHWAAAEDTVRQGFLVGAGWALDGSSRAIGFDEEFEDSDEAAAGSAVRLDQVRLHTAL